MPKPALGYTSSTTSTSDRLRFIDNLAVLRRATVPEVSDEVLAAVWAALDEGGVVVVAGTDHPHELQEMANHMAAGYGDPVCVVHWGQFRGEFTDVPFPPTGPVLVTVNAPEALARSEFEIFGSGRMADLVVSLPESSQQT